MRVGRWIAVAALPIAIAAFVRARPTDPSSTGDGTVVITVTPGRPRNIFVPEHALGGAVDGQDSGDAPAASSPRAVREMRSAGLRSLTYRLRTELAIEAWHWNPRGSWSDKAQKQGYWTSSDADASIRISYGYRLPRRGSSIDQANDDGYSRLDDGDAATFWKSNPYLDRRFTGEDNARHPQQVVIDLGRETLLNAIRLRWAHPYATRYDVQYWRGRDELYSDDPAPGAWRTFSGGHVERGGGGDTTIRLGAAPDSARFVRIRMLESSGTALPGARDPRDSAGYALREIFAGTLDAENRLRDVVRHGRTARGQTTIYVSSTDPWHRAVDLDPRVQQPGFDLIWGSGLTNGLPVLVPVGVLYDTPENAAAELRWLARRGYTTRGVEMGEEPDGQFAAPEDYAALYLQVADAMHAVDPALRLGGPVFQSPEVDVMAWPRESEHPSWLSRFLGYLRERGRSRDFGFFSFEWYPFDDVCSPTAPQLARAPAMLRAVVRRLERDGLARDIPWVISEYGYSAFAGHAEVELPAALLNAEIVGQFLTLGGDAAFLYGYEPHGLEREPTCDGWGNNTMLLAESGGGLQRLPAFYAARLLAREWAQPGGGAHRVYDATSDIVNEIGQPLVTAYAVARPDSLWSVLLINKDPVRGWAVRIRFQDASGRPLPALHGRADLFQYSGTQYAWEAAGERGHPTRSLPPDHRVLRDGGEEIALPPYSLSVVRRRGPSDRAGAATSR
ncbi:MAG: discoidin domain-containing protein [Gemmatimonadota bacterium]|nr:discoidin domain-containing protein [Gemmatimonadota bacterium]